MPVTIVMAAVALVSSTVTVVESAKNRKATAAQNAATIAAEKAIANQTNQTNLMLGETADVTSIENTTISGQQQLDSSAITAATSAAATAVGNEQTAISNNNGNAVMILSGSIFVISLTVVVFRLANKHKAISS